MTGTIHFGSAPDGSIVHFPTSAVYYLKVCDSCGAGYGVDIVKGKLYSSITLRNTYGDECFVVADNLNELFYGEDVGE